MSIAQIIDKVNIPEGQVSVGQKVKIQDLASDEIMEYTLVVAAEADFAANKLAVTSPVGKGLVGHKVDDIVKITIPAGQRKYKILKISLA